MATLLRCLVGVGLVVTLISPNVTWAQYPSEVVGFNGPPIDDPATSQEMFLIPQYSGSTDAYVVANSPDLFDWNGAYRAVGLHTEGAALEAYFTWVDPADPDAWVRLTTFNGEERPNPALDTRGKVRFKLTNRSQLSAGTVGFCLGIRETGADVGQLRDGGTSGDIEWVGVDPTPNGIVAGPNGIVDTEAANDDIQEYPLGYDIVANGLPTGTAVISPGPNGDIDTTPAPDDELRAGYFLSATGGRVPIPAITLAPRPGAYILEWDLATGDVTVDGAPVTAGIAAMTGNGILDALNDRGTLEHVAITNLSSDVATNIDFGIDELQFEATVPDPVLPPQVLGPVFAGDTLVEVQCTVGASNAELFVNDTTINAAGVTPDPVSGIAEFETADGLPTLFAGDILTAKQTKDSAVSGFSLPLQVFEPGVLMADDFDSYTTQAELNDFWIDSIENPDPPDAKLLLQAGGAASCPNFLREENPTSNAARLYRDLGGVDGTDEFPLLVTWNFKFTGPSANNVRTRFELAHFDGAPFSVGARGEGTVGITLYNAILGDLLNQYNLTIKVDSENVNYAGMTAAGWTDSDGFLRAPSGVTKATGQWHKMAIEVKTTTVNYYIDDILVNPAGYELGVPRPNDTEYDYVIIGRGFSNGGALMMFDNISVTQAPATHPFDPPVTSSPEIVEPVYPGLDTVTVEGVIAGFERVSVLANGLEIGFDTSGVVGTDGILDVPVAPALANLDVVTTTQTVAGDESCDSMPVTVGVPQVSILDTVLVPGQTTLDVTDLTLEAGTIDFVNVYVGTDGLIGQEADVVSDPATVTVDPLVFGDLITAQQVINGVPGAFSEAVEVTVPAVTVIGPLAPNDTIVTVVGVHPLATDVKVYANTIEVGSADVSASSDTEVDVTLSSGLFDGDEVWATQIIGGEEGPVSDSVFVQLGLCQVIFSEDFDVDASADWDVAITAGGEAAVTFDYDYSAIGIPPSPNGGGSTLGAKFEVNMSTGVASCITIFPTGESFSGTYRLKFDMWMNANGPFPGGGTGSTEFLTAGIGSDGTTVNHLGSTGTGGWFAATGEGGSSRDYRAYKNGGEQFAESGQFFAGTSSALGGAHNASDPYYSQFGSIDVPATVPDQTTLYPNQTGTTQVGSAGFEWHEVTVTVDGSTALWQIDGLNIAALDPAIGSTFDLDGNIALGYGDIFTSVSDNPAVSIGIIDNVIVAEAHTAGGLGDWNADMTIGLDDYEVFVDCMSGPDADPAPITGPGCRQICVDVFDFDSDNDVDLQDALEFQNQFEGS